MHRLTSKSSRYFVASMEKFATAVFDAFLNHLSIRLSTDPGKKKSEELLLP
jgi:hypothetical protein